MATSYSFGSLNPGKNQVELLDVIGLFLVGALAPMLFGVMSFSIDVFGGYDLTDPIWVLGGADISAAFLLCLFGGFWVLITNLVNSDTSHSREELLVFSGVLLAPAFVVLMPPFEALVFWHELTQIMFSLYVVIGTVLMSYLG